MGIDMERRLYGIGLSSGNQDLQHPHRMAKSGKIGPSGH
jgi:hypothetical protein